MAVDQNNVEIDIGKRVVQRSGARGIVVAVIEKNRYYDDSFENFSYLMTGVVIKNDDGCIIYIEDYENSLICCD